MSRLSPDGERPDEAVDGAVAAPVGRAVGHRAEHGATEPLWTRDIITPGHMSRVSLTYTRVRGAARRLLAAPGRAGGGAGYGQPVRGAHRVTHLVTNQSTDQRLSANQRPALTMTPVSPPPDGVEMEKASVSWSHRALKNPDNSHF